MTSLQFLTKQTAALKEVNESRVRIYEQIEISLSELETNNLRLSEDSATEKSKIRRLVFSSDQIRDQPLTSDLTMVFVFQSFHHCDGSREQM